MFRAVLVFALLTLLAPAALSQEATVRRPVPRKDAFFGLHFDLHPHKTDTELGADVTEEDLRSLLARVKPDFVQYDCKGHAGYTGYPTRVGWASPGIVKDSLAVWRKVTREHGAGLYVHYSGVWDMVAMEHHPEWAVVGPDGKRSANHASVFGPYVDRLLIPQLTEAATLYDLDGAWVDGECWAAQLDWSPAALEAWNKETGGAPAPRKRDDPGWDAWKAFHRRHFERYVSHWVDALHAARPGIQLTSNWMYSSFAPKRPEAKLDWLSGDYSPTLSVDRARVEARYLASVGAPWDLLAWGFNWADGLGHTYKPAVQLQQEAAVVLMQGGAFAVYYVPSRAGYISEDIRRITGEVADFCRARQKVCHKSVTVPQVALLFSAETALHQSDAVYGAPPTEDLEGALQALLESGYSVDVLAEWQLQPRLAEYPLVVVPDSYRLTEAFRGALADYVRGGGKLLLLGERCARLFEPHLGVTLEGPPAETAADLVTPLGLVNQNGVWQRVTPTTARALGQRHPTRDVRKGGETAATLARLGKGQVAAVWGPVARGFFRTHHPGLRRYVGGLVETLMPQPTLRVQGPPTIDAALRRTQDGRLAVNLLNTAGMPVGARHIATDFVPPVGPVTVRLRVPQRPRRVTWAPDGGTVRWTWEDGLLTATLPQVKVHGVLLVD